MLDSQSRGPVGDGGSGPTTGEVDTVADWPTGIPGNFPVGPQRDHFGNNRKKMKKEKKLKRKILGRF